MTLSKYYWFYFYFYFFPQQIRADGVMSKTNEIL